MQQWQPLACFMCVTIFTLLSARGLAKPEEPLPAEYTQLVKYDRAEHTLVYGDESMMRSGRTPLLADDVYSQFVASMPIVCVDVLLTRESDGKALLVKRHAEPVRGLYWFPGGRLLMRETFFEAALRKSRKEIGLKISACKVLGTWNTLFERSAWGGLTQTVNILVHAKAATDAHKPLRICGDRRGRCEDGHFGQYKWVNAERTHGEDTYILEGLAKLREQAAARQASGRPECDG